MKETHGNLIDLVLAGEADLLVHGANCQNTFGAGIALEIKNRLPQAYEADLKTVKGDKNKVGTYSYADGVNTEGKKIRIINAYTQFRYGRGKDMFEYEAFDKILKRLNAQYPGKRIAFPQIGAGHAGGDWERIKKSIETYLPDMEVVIVYYQKPQANFESKFKR